MTDVPFASMPMKDVTRQQVEEDIAARMLQQPHDPDAPPWETAKQAAPPKPLERKDRTEFRQECAMRVMVRLLYAKPNTPQPEEVADLAVRYTDALWSRLNQPHLSPRDQDDLRRIEELLAKMKGQR